MWALQEHPFITLFPINPLTSAKLRQAFFPSGAKSDPLDSDLLLDILRHHRDRLRPFQLDEVQTRLLERLTQDRRGAVEQRKSCVQQITAALKEYFPLALEVLGKLECNLAARFLLKWATLEEMIDHQQKSPAKIAYKKVQANRTVGLKLTASQVKTIKKTLSSSSRQLTIKKLADKYGVSEMTMYRIKSGENWGRIK